MDVYAVVDEIRMEGRVWPKYIYVLYISLPFKKDKNKQTWKTCLYFA